MRALTCTVLFAISSVAYASGEPGAGDSWDSDETGSDLPGDDESGDDESGDEEPGWDDPDADADPGMDDEGFPGIDEGQPEIDDDPIGPDPIPEAPEVDPGQDPAPEEASEIEWGGEATLVAVVDSRSLEGWGHGLDLHPGPVAVYQLDDSSMLGDGVNSVYVNWEGSFEDFGGEGLSLRGPEMQVVVTTEAYGETLEDYMHFDGEAPQGMVLVESRYLSAEVDGAYAIVFSAADGWKVSGVRSMGGGQAYVPVREGDVTAYLVAAPDGESAIGQVYAPWTMGNGWDGLDMGEGWEDSADWRQNAPAYAIEGWEAPETELPGDDEEPERADPHEEDETEQGDQDEPEEDGREDREDREDAPVVEDEDAPHQQEPEVEPGAGAVIGDPIGGGISF